MDNPWLKLATLSLFSILIILVLLWGINSWTVPQRSVLGNPAANWQMYDQQWNKNPSQVPQLGMYPPNNFYSPNSNANLRYMPPANIGTPQYQSGNGRMGTWGYMQGMGNSRGIINNRQSMDAMNGMMNDMQHMNGMMGNMNGMDGM